MPNKGTRLEVDLDALRHNYRFLRSKLDAHTQFMGVVKANAYGHGMVEVAKTLVHEGADYLAVAYTDEGVELRNAGIQLPILVLHPQIHHLSEIFDFNLEPVVYGWQIMEEICAFAKANMKTALPLHIEFNTGLNRLGFECAEAEMVAEYIIKHSLNIKGISSHLAASEDPKENEFTEQQIRKFIKAADQMELMIGHKMIRHQSNTSGVLNHEDARFDIVRTGIGLYGYGNHSNYDRQLKQVGRLVTNISQIRELKAGDTVSYNRQFTAEQDMRCAVLALGHGDGLNRIYGHGKSYVFINGKKARTLGIMCMDMFMVDVTDIDCQVGDDVEIFGRYQNASEFAGLGGTISYELLTGIQSRVPRVYLNT